MSIAEVGNEAPAFTIPYLDNENQTIQLTDLQGQFIVINLWASWCEPCIKELPLLDELDQRFEEIRVLAVNRSDLEIADERASQFIYDNPVLMDVLTDDHKGEFSKRYPYLVGLPTTYLINKSGIVVDIISGELTEAIINEKIISQLD